LGDHGLLSNSPENDSDGYSVQLAYDFSATPSRATVLEYGPGRFVDGVTDTLRTPFRLTWDVTNSRFEFNWNDASNVRTFNIPAPTKGVLGLDITRRGGTLRAYHNGMLTSTASNSATLNTNVGSSFSSRWVLAGSVYSGSGYSAPGMLLDGIIERVTVWRRPLGDDGHMAKYGQIVQPWDDTALLESNTAKYAVKVEVADNQVPPNWTDLTNFHGSDFVDSVSITESVDSVLATAKVSLFRRLGRYDDLSPLNQEQEVLGVLGLRKRIRIRRAMVPANWQIQGWEFKTRFDGYIDSVTMPEDKVELSCSDGLAPLQDAYISESRGYNYVAGAKSMEVVHRDLIDEYEPSLDRKATLIGYRGYLPDTPPINYTVCGTAYTAWFRPSSFQINYHDVSSGSVLSALSALTDQIGYGVRWKHHPPWDGFRLTSFAPPRNKTLLHRQSTTLSLTRIQVDCHEPHGLTLGSVATLSGKVDHNSGLTVSSILDYYRFVAEGSFTAAPTTETAGTLTFDSNLRLREEDLLEIGAVSSAVDRIRNSCRVRINRKDQQVTRDLPTTTNDASDILTINFEDPTVSFDHLDPDDQGITFTIETDAAETGNVVKMAGSYTGLVTGRRQITATIPTDSGVNTGSYPVGGINTVADGVTIKFPTITIQSEAFSEVVSTATASVQAYGLLPMAIFEGSNLAIDTETEAQTLADSVISDTAFPTYDVAFSTRVLPLMLHDVVQLPVLTKGRWTQPVNVALTAITEKYRSGQCVAEYGGRFDYPSLGLAWVSNIMDRNDRPSMTGVNTSQVDVSGVNFVSDHAGMIQYRRLTPRGIDATRYDRTEVWISRSASYVPSRGERALLVRGDSAHITHDSTGAPIVPGRQYYGRVADRDIFGNLTNITDIDAAAGTIANTLSTVVRFQGRTANAKVVTSAATTFAANAVTFSVASMFQIDNGTDASAVSFDTYDSYSTATRWFRVPADGVVLASAQIPLVAAKANAVCQGRFDHFNSSGSFLYSSDVTSAATIAAVSGVGSLCMSETLTCSSGDYIQLKLRDTVGASSQVLGVTTASGTYGRVQYALVAQN